jgi:predicted ribosomally synthesized peptide with nif11-like leader
MESALVFMQSVASDANLQARLAAASGPQAYLNVAAECWFDVSIADMEHALGIDDDLSEEKLTPKYADACSYCFSFCVMLHDPK